jgi:quinohemoprotein ethanol dehydrogenase
LKKSEIPASNPRSRGWRSGVGKFGLAAFALATVFCGAALAQGVASGLSSGEITKATKAVNGKYIVANAKTSADWPSVGLDYAETRYSRLTQINADNVKGLGLVWTYNLHSTRGVEATPVVVNGIMYVTAPWSIVTAIDVRTGQPI